MGSSVRWMPWLGPAVLIAGLAILAAAVGRGEASVFLVAIVPVVAASGPLAFLGILLTFVGFFLAFLFWPMRFVPQRAEEGEGPMPPEGAPPPRRWGGVLFLGPLPLVFGSDPRMTRTMLLVGVVLFLALLALTVYALLA